MFIFGNTVSQCYHKGRIFYWEKAKRRFALVQLQPRRERKECKKSSEKISHKHILAPQWMTTAHSVHRLIHPIYVRSSVVSTWHCAVQFNAALRLKMTSARLPCLENRPARLSSRDGGVSHHGRVLLHTAWDLFWPFGYMLLPQPQSSGSFLERRIIKKAALWTFLILVVRHPLDTRIA